MRFKLRISVYNGAIEGYFDSQKLYHFDSKVFKIGKNGEN